MKIEGKEMDIGCLPCRDLGFGIGNVANETNDCVFRLAG
jgi:hypothetical protein